MARADNKLAEGKIAAIRARFQNADVHRFLHGLPVFQVEEELPESLEEKLDRLEKAEDDQAKSADERSRRRRRMP